ncbi:hypothetical protein E8E12_008055 [Didymella heteroderae]|uniref:Ankyrin n=1 Tax=Didymella heteroderae TaxID=1769908 RepID=A0A9P5C3A6_9PLEO|nr:hypothetical protein E8E12_008055 [Didymella heteroderae]
MSGRAKRNRVLKWILSALKRSFHQRTILSIWTDSDAVIAYSGLVAAFDAALKKSWHQAVEAIYDTCQQFGCTAYYAHVDPHINSIVMQSCIDRDWDRAIEAVNKPEATAGSHQPPSTWHEDRERAEHEKVFEKAMLAEDVQTIDELFNEQPWRWEWIETSKKSKSDAIAALAAIHDASTHENDEPLLPSLLGVAVLQDHDPTIITHLLGQHIACRDSDALLHAVQSKAQPDIIQVLLSANPSGGAVSRTQYGSAALRVAILDQNYELMRVLAPVTDIHGLGQIDHDDRNLAYLDPLGEAVLQKDRAAVQILLENSADLNRVVVFEGLQKSTPRSASNSVLLRMTPLLIAIDVGDYDMVQFLVDSGAEINRDARLGLLRTPLQRASEIGDFEMVEYLISQGATIDSAPVYGGGTALQLAAMSGHTGIAKLLIENGADVNHAPAHGPGRTAFEAAAEWFRPDMMNLLVQHGARLDMEIGQEVEECVERQGKVFRAYESVAVWRTELKWRTQYERALQFAEDRKEYVSKGIVEKLGRLFGIHMDGNVLEITY